MLKRPQLRAAIFAVHGAVALGCGLAVLYLGLLAGNPFFSAIAIVIALVLCGAAITLAGIADWFAAAETARRNLQQILLYALAGLCLVAAGSFLGFSSSRSVTQPVAEDAKSSSALPPRKRRASLPRYKDSSQPSSTPRGRPIPESDLQSTPPSPSTQPQTQQ